MQDNSVFFSLCPPNSIVLVAERPLSLSVCVCHCWHFHWHYFAHKHRVVEHLLVNNVRWRCRAGINAEFDIAGRDFSIQPQSKQLEEQQMRFLLKLHL